ncbi:MAG: DUF695 domain-containing protein [Deltaproteobacteria bacterium]|nr:DUF695 domain-containing protein [Deltaproteobacteria bacterium]
MSGDDAYEFYPCLVDEAPASIYVNLRFESSPPPAADTRYTIAIAMREQGEYGIGNEEEAAALDLVEQAIIARAAAVAVTYVGRVRTRGVWETVLYGPAGHLDELRALATERVGNRRVDARSERDASWRYYHELLVPDAERLQWMDDRRMVEILREQGDRLASPRRVDHQLAFPTEHARDAFAATATTAGFTLDGTDDTGDTELPHRVRVHRADPIELDHIHEVVMTLVDAAVANGGRYHRWVAGIVT